LFFIIICKIKLFFVLFSLENSFFKIRYGADIRTLNVMIQTVDANSKIFTRDGPQGNMWRKGQIEFQSSLDYRIIFEGIGKFNSNNKLI
jgi:hypothetical protein